MANTFTLKSVEYQTRYLELVCKQTTNIAKNQSTIDWTLSSIGGTSNNYSTGPTTLTIAGKQAYYCHKKEWNTYEFPAARGSTSGQLVVDHDANGNLTIAVSLSTNIATGVIHTSNGSWTLDKIPRQATITSASDFTDVGNPTITFSNPGNFPMDVWLEPNPIGDHFCVREGIPNTGSYTWELSDEERETLRSKCTGKSCKIRLGLYSYVGGVQYADYKDMTYTMTENEATKPAVSMDVVAYNEDLPSDLSGEYIQGKTRLKIELSAEGKYGADIDSYWVTVEDKTYAYNGEAIITDVLQKTGLVEAIGYAKDSREFTGSDNQPINVDAYSKPLVIPIAGENAILCYRSDGNGNRIGNSTSVWIKAKRFYYQLQGLNACTLEWRSKLINEAWDDTKHEWKDLLEKYVLPGIEYNAMIEGVFDPKKSYAIQIRAIDDLGEYDIKTFEIPTEDVALHLGKGGKNVTVGTYCDYSEEYTFRSGWKGIFDEDLLVGGDILIGANKTSLKDYILNVINGGG